MPSQTLIARNESEAQQAEFLAQAYAIYLERSKTRGENWARFDQHDAFHHMRSKLSRIQVLLNSPDMEDMDPVDWMVEILDDTLDLINYAVFLARHVTGKKPKVPAIDF